MARGDRSDDRPGPVQTLIRCPFVLEPSKARPGVVLEAHFIGTTPLESKYLAIYAHNCPLGCKAQDLAAAASHSWKVRRFVIVSLGLVDGIVRYLAIIVM